MKEFIFCILLFATTQATALQKCVVDGKTIYKQGICTQGTTMEISGLDRQVRQSIAIEKQKKAQAELAAQAGQNIEMGGQQGTQAELERQAMEVPNGSMTPGEWAATNARAKNAQRALGWRTPIDDKLDRLENQMRINKVFRENGQREPY